MKLLLLAAAFSLVSPHNLDDRTYPVPPSPDMSAIRYLYCHDDSGEAWTGTGFLIGDKELLTAAHVGASGQCYDVETKSAVKPYATDKTHDITIMTGASLPTDIPYIKYTCSRFKTGQPYLSYGITDYGQEEPIMRNNVIIAQKGYTQPGDTLGDGTPITHMREFNGAIAPGMSGGPVEDVYGYAHGLNNAGDAVSTIIYEFADSTLLCPQASPARRTSAP